MENIAIILAGGVGSRVGADIPKQFIKVLDKPIISYTVDLYQQHPQIDAIEIVCHQSYIDYCKELVEQYGHTKVRWICNGGDTFQDSCLNGIRHLETQISPADNILIHYAAAPFTTADEITDAIRICTEKGNAVCGIPCFQLMGSRDEGEVSKTWVDRDQYIQITCPYCFNYGFVSDLYREAIEKGLLSKVEPHTTTLMQYMGHQLYLSKGYQSNMKITTREDLVMFHGYILAKQYKEQHP